MARSRKFLVFRVFLVYAVPIRFPLNNIQIIARLKPLASLPDLLFSAPRREAASSIRHVEYGVMGGP